MQVPPALAFTALSGMLAVSCSHAPEPSATAASEAPSRTTAPEPFGFSRPVVVQAASFRWRWVAACFAQSDTDRDGAIEIFAGRHGRILGDEVFPYLLVQGERPERIGELLLASPDQRFLAFAKGGVVWVHDAQTGRRWNLSDLGAIANLGEARVLGQELLAFSARGHVAFIGLVGGHSEVRVLDLTAGDVEPIYRTANRIWRIAFSDSDKRVRVTELPTSLDEELPLQATRVAGPCTAPGTYATFATRTDVREVYARIEPAARDEFPAERVVVPVDECTPSHQVPLASSSTGEHLVASFTRRKGQRFESGPLRWIRAPVSRRFCSAPTGE